MGVKSWIVEKLNPGQSTLYDNEDSEKVVSRRPLNLDTAYKNLEIVNRGVNYIVDSAAEFDLDIKDKLQGIPPVGSKILRPEKLKRLLNHQPNPYLDIDTFRRNIFMDLIIEGNAFLYWDGSYFYNIPASSMEVVKDKVTFVSHYMYAETTRYETTEILHIRDNSSESIYVGTSRLESAKASMLALSNMQEFHSNFFENGAIPGLILKSPDVLSERFKKKKLQEWRQSFNPKTGGRRPVILDGGFEIETLSSRDLRELDFQESIKAHELKISKALGVPHILLESGNNANITPNVRLFYTSTTLPLVNKLIKGLERFFGYDIDLITQNIIALRPDLRDEAAYYSTLVNAGIMTRNEARTKLRLPDSVQDFADELVLPANIAGSAVDPTTGGKPAQDPPT